MLTNDCKQHVVDPTRVTRYIEYLLNLIITNSDFSIKNVFILDISFSDHNVTSCDIEFTYDEPTTILKEFRCYKNFNLGSFVYEAEKIGWNYIYNINSIEEKVDFF